MVSDAVFYIGFLVFLIVGAVAFAGIIRAAFVLVIIIATVLPIQIFVSDRIGEDGFWMIVLAIGVLLFFASLWARAYDPDEAAHKRRIKRAQEQRRARREAGEDW